MHRSIGTLRAPYRINELDSEGRRPARWPVIQSLERNMMVDLILLAMVIASAVSLCVVSPKLDVTVLPALTEEAVRESLDTGDSGIADEAA